ncbi:Acetyltransferase, GNAT superfamily [Halanaeroarchaeum sp. HSR-CO]|uniref:GNAT family N-acetyltransferase n=1 Tax=Halanaeroarchaeum sp. HSR-CO TaxID=2866382 RepID=UPI00217EA68A|nr:GNAT family N-acetyltransferase [Halanaeroarchaeum sp. HSR-CO]UWG48007.1 Acetyltransferase, GNAT superfamily [Halanaeroarchaeum sp. HSR-CO]
MVEYRPFPEDRRATFSAMLSYAFSPELGPFAPADEDETPPQARVGENRGLFDGDHPVSVCRHHFFDTRVRGTTLSMGGISAVATPPEHRRKGYIRRLLTETLGEYRDRDVPVASLWPFETSFYAQFGWATAFRTAVQTADPAVYRIGDPPAGRYYRAEKDDWDALDAVLDSHAHEYELAVDRSESWWRNRAFHGWETDPYVYVWEHDGRPSGYVVYAITEEDDEKTLDVWDMAFRDTDAHHALLGFLANHDSQVETVRLPTPPREMLLDLVADPEELDVSLKTGAMVRIVDVEMAFEAITYPEDVDGQVVLSVTDPLVDWNDGTFALDIADGVASVSTVDRPADVDVDIGSLSQLFVGYRDLETMATENTMTVEDHFRAAVLDNSLPASSVYLREGF